MAEQIVDLMEANMPVSSDVAAVARSAGGAAGLEAGAAAGRGEAAALAGVVSSRVDALSARVDSIVASGGGDGGEVGDELRDVRVEWTGGTAASAGGAVRAQFEDMYGHAVKNPVANNGFVNSSSTPEPPYDDLDTFEKNTLVVVDNNGVAHRPVDSLMYVLTLGSTNYSSDSLLKYQLALTYDGSLYCRYIHGNEGAAWSKWTRSNKDYFLDRSFNIPEDVPLGGIFDSNMEPPWDDCDTFESNSMAVCSSTKIRNLPVAFGSGFVVTLGMTRAHSDDLGVLKVQIALPYRNAARNKIQWRMLWGDPDNRTWTDWIGASQNEATMSNPYPNGGLIGAGEAKGVWEDADTFWPNTVVMVADVNVANLPVALNGWMLTYGASTAEYRTGGVLDGKLRMQVFHAYDGSVYWRYVHGSSGSEWTRWIEIGGAGPASVPASEYVDFGIFDRIACLGDSYTQGGIAGSSGSYVDVQTYGKPWPRVVAERSHITADNYGVGGSTTKSYWASNLANVLSGPAADGYFYCWGINDATDSDDRNQAWDGLDPMGHLGTPDDIVADADATPANTFYGYYSSIIRKCMAHAPKALHTLIAMPTANPDNAVNKAYIEATLTLAERMGLPCIDPRDDPFFQSSTYRAMNAGHPTRLGYVGMAKAYTRLFSACVEEHHSYYKNAVIG